MKFPHCVAVLAGDLKAGDIVGLECYGQLRACYVNSMYVVNDSVRIEYTILFKQDEAQGTKLRHVREALLKWVS